MLQPMKNQKCSWSIRATHMHAQGTAVILEGHQVSGHLVIVAATGRFCCNERTHARVPIGLGKEHEADSLSLRLAHAARAHHAMQSAGQRAARPPLQKVAHVHQHRALLRRHTEPLFFLGVDSTSAAGVADG